MSTRSPGRPRSEPARRAILAAGARLVEDEGYGALTMQRIARSAGVSKQTVYRWWPSKAAVVLEAVNEAAQAAAPAPNAGSLETDLRGLLRSTVAGITVRNPRMLAALMAEAQLDEDFARAFRSGFLARRREVLLEVLERARARGEIAESVETEFLAELVFGAVWYRILSRHAPLDRRFADQLTESVLALAGAAIWPERPRRDGAVGVL